MEWPRDADSVIPRVAFLVSFTPCRFIPRGCHKFLSPAAWSSELFTYRTAWLAVPCLHVVSLLNGVKVVLSLSVGRRWWSRGHRS